MAKKIVASIKSDGNVYSIDEDGLDSNLNSYSNLLNSVKSMDFDTDSIDSEILSTSFAGNMRSSSSIIDLGKNLLRYAKENNFKGIQQMLNKGAPFSADWLGMTAIHFTALLNNYEACELLLRAGINKDAKTKVDRSPLHFAVFYGNEKITQLLLSNNCAVNSRDLLRMTPLHWAVEQGHKEIVTLLLEHNADVTAISKFGKTPIAIAVQTEQADLLEQLQHAKKQQEYQKYSEQQQKEMNEAINSITGITEDLSPITTSIRVSSNEIRSDNCSNLYAKSPIEQIKNINSTKKDFESTGLDLLNSHGISMMQDDDPSNTLLTTALKNGRKLVVSEGGKLLLNDIGIKDESSQKTLKISSQYLPIETQLSIENQESEENQPKSSENLVKLKSITKPKHNAKKILKLISIQELRKMCGPDKVKPLKASQDGNLLSKMKKTHGVPFSGKRVFVNLKSNACQKMSSSSLSQEYVKNDDILYEEHDLPLSICKRDSDCESLKTSPSKKSESKCMVESHRSALPINNPITLTDVSRNMFDMKKQIEELERKYELLQEENISFRTRIYQLESIIKGTVIHDDYDSANLINTNE